ncbi:MAG TPA: hypothetical protein VGS19_03590 [Streptosporangiaceae bacterium]|nr:hypothetical protein [Streptosporangiaceae bacterium]
MSFTSPQLFQPAEAYPPLHAPSDLLGERLAQFTAEDRAVLIRIPNDRARVALTGHAR